MALWGLEWLPSRVTQSYKSQNGPLNPPARKTHPISCVTTFAYVRSPPSLSYGDRSSSEGPFFFPWHQVRRLPSFMPAGPSVPHVCHAYPCLIVTALVGPLPGVFPYPSSSLARLCLSVFKPSSLIKLCFQPFWDPYSLISTALRVMTTQFNPFWVRVWCRRLVRL